MITDVISSQLAAGGLGLVKGNNLFTEQGQGDQFVVVRTTTIVDQTIEISQVRRGSVQVYITGYRLVDGMTLANQITAIIEALQGDYTFGSENYRIYSVIVKNRPFPFPENGAMKITINFAINFYTDT